MWISVFLTDTRRETDDLLAYTVVVLKKIHVKDAQDSVCPREVFKNSSTALYLVIQPQVIKHQLCAWRFCCFKTRTSKVGTEEREESHAQGVFKTKMGNSSY